MKNNSGKFFIFTAAAALFLSSAPVSAQIAAGGAYTLEQAVVANGGGTSGDAGNAYKIEGTSGQNAAGTYGLGGVYALRGGFWAGNPLAPTAAGASLSGRVAGIKGEGLRNITVVLSGGTLLVPRTARTNSFGNFTFEDVEVGHVYTISVQSKKYGFSQDSHILSVVDRVADIIFQAAWEN
jgi:hypothetical protein